jgi:hypothetical protein
MVLRPSDVIAVCRPGQGTGQAALAELLTLAVSGQQATPLGSCGSSWTATNTTPVGDHVWTASCWSPQLGLYCAVSSTGLMLSSDGWNWQPVSLAVSSGWTDVEWSPQLGLFVAVSNTVTGAVPNVAWSADGRTWVSAGYQPGAWRGLCWAAELGLFVAVSGGSPAVMVSRDGKQWQPQTAPEGSWRRVCWSPSQRRLVTTSEAGTAMWSVDGLSWRLSSSTIAGMFLSTVWAEKLGLFVSMNANPTVGDAGVKHSPDGDVWTAVPLFNFGGRELVWADSRGLLVAVSNAGDSKRVATSKNGSQWLLGNAASGTTANWNTVVWSPQRAQLCAFGTTGAGNRVMVSP